MSPDKILRIAMYILFVGVLCVTVGNLMERNGVAPPAGSVVRYVGLASLAVAVLLAGWSKWKER